MATDNKPNKNRPEETVPGKMQVPDICREDADLLKKGRTEKGNEYISTNNNETANPGRADRGEQEPVDDNVTP